MFRTATTTAHLDADAWRGFDDAAERRDQIAADLAGALTEPGF